MHGAVLPRVLGQEMHAVPRCWFVYVVEALHHRDLKNGDAQRLGADRKEQQH